MKESDDAITIRVEIDDHRTGETYKSNHGIGYGEILRRKTSEIVRDVTNAALGEPEAEWVEDGLEEPADVGAVEALDRIVKRNERAKTFPRLAQETFPRSGQKRVGNPTDPFFGLPTVSTPDRSSVYATSKPSPYATPSNAANPFPAHPNARCSPTPLTRDDPADQTTVSADPDGNIEVELEWNFGEPERDTLELTEETADEIADALDVDPSLLKADDEDA